MRAQGTSIADADATMMPPPHDGKKATPTPALHLDAPALLRHGRGMWRLALLLLLVVPAVARAAPPADLVAGGTGEVVEVVDGDTVELADGRAVRLVGIQAPRLALGRAGFRDWPMADAARDRLAHMVDGRRVTLHFGGARTDRHRRALAHLALDDGTWVQGAMIEAGLARVYVLGDNRAAAAEMLALERAARAARRGIWALDFYRVRAPDDLGRDVDTFQIVEGRAASAALVRGTLYINFGADRRTDTTIVAEPIVARDLVAAGIEAERLAGRMVRARGWVGSRNGPEIRLAAPEMLEVDPQ
jgi:endonuclease YncB( thermonuclease family)